MGTDSIIIMSMNLEGDVIKAPVGIMCRCIYSQTKYCSCKYEVKLKAFTTSRRRNTRSRDVKFESKCYNPEQQIHLISKGVINTPTHKTLSGARGARLTCYRTCAFNTDDSVWYLVWVGEQKAPRQQQQRKGIRKKEEVKSDQLNGLRVICSMACNWFCVIVVMSDRC